VVAGVFVTAFYSFRMYFLVFHGKENFRHKPFPGEHDHHDDEHGHHEPHVPHESPWVVWLPLVLLAIPSVVIGYLTIQPLLFGDFLKDAVVVNAEVHRAMISLSEHFHGPAAMAAHALQTVPLWLAVAGVALAWWMYLVAPSVPVAIGKALSPIVRVLENKYYFDAFNEKVLAAGARLLGTGFWKGGDVGLIDGLLVNGSARVVGVFAGLTRLVQTGQLYWYALVMVLGIFGLLTWQLWPFLSKALGN